MTRPELPKISEAGGLVRRSPAMQFRLRSLLVAMTVLAVVFALVPLVRSLSSRKGFAEQAAEAPIANLPADAEQIEYYLPGPFDDLTYYSFRTSEESFLRWVREVHGGGEPFIGSSVGFYGRNAGLLHPAVSIRWDVKPGYMYSSSEFQLLYDSKTGRALYMRWDAGGD